MIRNSLTIAAAAAIAAVGARAETPVFADVEPGAISEATMKEVTKTLSSDEFEGREPGTAGEEKTLDYLVEKLRDAGLQPGNDGSWFQDVPLVEITADNFEELRIGGPAADLRYRPRADWVGVTYREDRRIDLDDSEIVFVGFGINAPEKGWNDYAGVDMRGKTALILVNDPDYDSEELQGTFNGKAMTYYGRWTYKYEEAARQGAAAALIVHEDYPAAYGWNVVESSWTGPQAYAERGNGGADQTMVNGWVQKEVAEAILQAAGQDFLALSAAAKRPGFKPVALGLTASTGFDNSVRKFASKNVIGILPGSERPDEYVLHSAHWDHLGHCTPNAEGDDICNGAIDNATGTAALVALGEAHVKAGPTARTQVFLAVTAEESGLLGSEYYGATPVFPLDRTVGGLNMDALFLAGPAHDVTVVGGGKSTLDAYLDHALSDLGRVATPDSAPQAGYYYRSDHFSFAKRGVPMFYIDGGEDLLDGGRAAGEAYSAAYRENAYHGPDDEYDPAWDWSGVMQDLQLYYRLGRMLGETTDWPNWYEGDEFRAIRDESCAAEGGC
ncbi:Zn-dependent M28 family amino/carboxypeptidase [Altererythrobacter atlanticus]|uniref:Peptidase family M28 n=1 Tax=Croceibacterium atlanticum TaxID=1267766 RepID=A0A0F7KRQ5_9SPHN|nr:M28 family peptidase [Croceibacterium atlanticum]AKH43153.1 Peptidase family M28 [Croceibacterium atlanticum]MBB5732142.1 Zn-dependent M28 family amino/carboxypeptidase [Croceibacterium atlanticum]